MIAASEPMSGGRGTTHHSLFTTHQGSEYDAAGNRTKKTEDGNETNYSYDDFNKMTAAGSVSFGYDNNGNMTSKTENSQTTSYSYDYQNHMTGITYPDQSTNSFGYYGTGQRAWKVDSAGTSRFVYDGDEYGAPILAQVGGGGDYIATYTHGVQGLVSQRRGSTTNWYHFDDLGSTRDLTNSSQTITDAYTYKAFGEMPASSGSTTNPFRYIGALNYYKDSDSTFLLLGARYYAAQWGRFTTVDPIRPGHQGYWYVRNGPIARRDPTGRDDALSPETPAVRTAELKPCWVGLCKWVPKRCRAYAACITYAYGCCKKGGAPSCVDCENCCDACYYGDFNKAADCSLRHCDLLKGQCVGD